jgi:hypothetical protein
MMMSWHHEQTVGNVHNSIGYYYYWLMSLMLLLLLLNSYDLQQIVAMTMTRVITMMDDGDDIHFDPSYDMILSPNDTLEDIVHNIIQLPAYKFYKKSRTRERERNKDLLIQNNGVVELMMKC